MSLGLFSFLPPGLSIVFYKDATEKSDPDLKLATFISLQV